MTTPTPEPFRYDPDAPEIRAAVRAYALLTEDEIEERRQVLRRADPLTDDYVIARNVFAEAAWLFGYSPIVGREIPHPLDAPRIASGCAPSRRAA